MRKAAEGGNYKSGQEILHFGTSREFLPYFNRPELIILQNDFISHMKLVVRMVKTGGPTLKATYDVLNTSAYEVAEMRKEEEKLSLMSAAKAEPVMESELQSRISDNRFSIPTMKVTSHENIAN